MVCCAHRHLGGKIRGRGMLSCPHDAGRQTLPAAPAAKETAQKKSSRFSLSDKSTMAEERERSRSPDPAEAPADGGHAPADDQANGSSEPEGIKLYIGNLDYGEKLSEPFRNEVFPFTPFCLTFQTTSY